MRPPSRRPAATALGILAVAVTAIGTARPAGVAHALAADPPAAAPARAPRLLSETGLYGPDGGVDPRNLPFSPQYPLWTDGAAKSRWIRLPEGSSIDVSDVDAWRFPVGTKLWKEFRFAGRRVETRMIWKAGPDEWVFATYVWAEDGSDATLAPDDGVPDVVEVAPGKRHSIPGVEDCATCHRSSPAVVLGFNALQLSDDRDPLAPHAEPLPPGAATLSSLVASHRLEPSRPDLVANPPRIRASDPTERAALGYLSANCGGCHNATGPLARLGLVLLHDSGGSPDAPEPAVATAVDSAGRYVVPGLPEGASRVVAAGDPARSALLHRMRSRRPSSQMPPLGTRVVDEEAVALLSRWIARRDAPAAR
ncbi:hypothetical protein FBQ97_11580 [Acidobacteria bacterium ACD]|nr:MAG: hypothetical protein EDX89_19585 [Acidobacteriota bacterium]MDL1950439.1 hypothetical protein [Acidobacteria bacterium ACD]